MHQLHLWSKRYVVNSPNGLQLCKSYSGLCNPWENLWFAAIIWNNCSKVLEACYSAQLMPFYLYLSLDVIGAVCDQFRLLPTDLHLIHKPLGNKMRMSLEGRCQTAMSVQQLYILINNTLSKVYTFMQLKMLLWYPFSMCQLGQIHDSIYDSVIL